MIYLYKNYGNPSNLNFGLLKMTSPIDLVKAG